MVPVKRFDALKVRLSELPTFTTVPPPLMPLRVPLYTWRDARVPMVKVAPPLNVLIKDVPAFNVIVPPYKVVLLSAPVVTLPPATVAYRVAELEARTTPWLMLPPIVALPAKYVVPVPVRLPKLKVPLFAVKLRLPMLFAPPVSVRLLPVICAVPKVPTLSVMFGL